MKKYIVFPVFVFALNMLCFWYLDTLIDRLFVFRLIPLAIAILALIAGFIFSFVLIIRNRKNLKSYIALLISVITVIMILVFPFRSARVRAELILFEKDRMQVIEMVGGEIIPDSLGNAVLPPKYQHTSSDGHIFVHQNDEQQVITFWVFRGMLSGSVKLTYSSQGIDLIYKNKTGHPITSITKLKEHWYLVKTDY